MESLLISLFFLIIPLESHAEGNFISSKNTQFELHQTLIQFKGRNQFFNCTVEVQFLIPTSCTDQGICDQNIRFYAKDNNKGNDIAFEIAIKGDQLKPRFPIQKQQFYKNEFRVKNRIIRRYLNIRLDLDMKFYFLEAKSVEIDSGQVIDHVICKPAW